MLERIKNYLFPNSNIHYNCDWYDTVNGVWCGLKDGHKGEHDSIIVFDEEPIWTVLS